MHTMPGTQSTSNRRNERSVGAPLAAVVSVIDVAGVVDHWSLSVDWTRYDNVGDEDEDDDVSTEAGFDVDALSLSAAFRF